MITKLCYRCGNPKSDDTSAYCSICYPITDPLKMEDIRKCIVYQFRDNFDQFLIDDSGSKIPVMTEECFIKTVREYVKLLNEKKENNHA